MLHLSLKLKKMDNMIETYRGVVYPNQLDHMGHMNVQWYAAKFDEATWHFFSTVEITSDYISTNQKGMAALEQHISYKSEVMAGDLLFIQSQILEVKEKIMKFVHIMYNAETKKEIARCELTGIHMDRVKRKSCPLPENVLRKCKQLIKNK